ncbi:DUF4968 domain-containing protein [Sphingobacteriales bacterium UPWRP_1]|nr:hypothetical protein B6N25_10615 [Sphingobacteriales bacterium TSM_CSS]PSJ79024.1 DUF4968 domain-containing protein [Sphingobacteriales bacterium UPWRP_1]
MHQHRVTFTNRLFLIVLWGVSIYFPSFLHGQVSITPQNPFADTDTVTITYNPKEGNGALANETGAIYIHTGVVTDRSSHPMEWLHVQGEWGKANPLWEMKKNKEGLYEFKYVIRPFYKVPAEEQILKLMMVFRNADGSLVGKTAENTDFVITISQYEPPYIVMPEGVAAQYLGNYKSHTVRETQITIQTDNRALQIYPYSNHIIRFALSDKDGKFAANPSYTVVMKPASVVVKLKEDPDKLLIYIDNLTLTVNKTPLTVSVDRNGENLITGEKGIFWKNEAKGVSFGIDQTSPFYGGGSRAIDLNRRGTYLKLYNNAWYGYTKGADHLNVTAPFLISGKLWGLYFDNVDKAYFDIGKSRPDVLEYGTKNGDLVYYFLWGKSYDDLLENYAKLTGTQPLPPRWALGYIQSRFGYRTEAETREVVNNMIAAGFPIDAVVLDLYWFGDANLMGSIDWDRKQFPEPEKMISDFAAKGVKTILITEPFFTEQSKTFKDAIQKQLFATDSLGKPFIVKDFWAGAAGLLDIFKPEAQNWFWDLYMARIKEGVAGWWCDLGEPERHPAEIRHVAGNAERVHNIYSLYWAKMLYENYRRYYPQQRIFTLMRSGFSGMQRYGAVTWSGDIQRSFKGLSIQPSIMLGMGLNGFAYMHSDLGGFTDGPQNEELYIRWLQYGMFNPIVRPHGFQVPPEPIFYSNKAQDILRRYTRLRYQLLPYNYTLAWENSAKGTPLARPLFYYAPNDTILQNVSDEYYWGKSMLIVPVTQAGQTERRFYLPAGQWFNFHTGQPVSGGGWKTAPVSLEDIPVFVKAGSFIPMAPPMQNTDKYRLDTLSVHYYPDVSEPDNFYSLYWDNGITPDAQGKNQFELLHFKGLVNAKQIKMILDKTGGSYNEMPAQRQIELVIHNLPKIPRKWTLKQKGNHLPLIMSQATYKTTAKGALYDKASQTLYLKFNWEGNRTELLLKL